MCSFLVVRFGQSFHLLPYFEYVSSVGSGQTVLYINTDKSIFEHKFVIFFFYPSIYTCIFGAQNCLYDTGLLSSQNMFWLKK